MGLLRPITFNNTVKRILGASRWILIVFRRLMKLLCWYPLIYSGFIITALWCVCLSGFFDFVHSPGSDRFKLAVCPDAPMCNHVYATCKYSFLANECFNIITFTQVDQGAHVSNTRQRTDNGMIRDTETRLTTVVFARRRGRSCWVNCLS